MSKKAYGKSASGELITDELVGALSAKAEAGFDTDEVVVRRALKAAEIFCEVRSPDEFRDEVRVTCSRRGGSITIFEERAPWRPDYGPDWSKLKVAQLRFDGSTSTWSLYCRDSNEKWWSYDEVPASPSVDALLAEIDRDPTGIFWG